MQVICSICQEIIIESDVIVAEQCGHIYHNHCILKWISQYA
jgi:hypothetical protein